MPTTTCTCRLAGFFVESYTNQPPLVSGNYKYLFVSRYFFGRLRVYVIFANHCTN